MPGEQAPKAQQEAPKAQQEGVPQGDDAKVRQLRDLLRELSGGKAELDEGRVRDLVEEQTDWVSHKLDELERRIEERPVTRLEIKQGDDVRVVEGVHHPELARLIRYLSVGVNVWLSGPSGSGKTHSAEQAASALGLSFALHGAMTMAHELVGFVDAAGHYHTTPFVRAFRDGGLVLLDELDAGSNEALLCLNGALANGIMCLANGEIIRRHKDFRCIGAANTMGTGATHEYVGRTRIDAAFLQRFGAAIVWDYDETLETAISGNPDWSAYVQKARAKAKELGFKILVTPRASIDGARLIATGDTFREAAIMTFGRGLTADQRTQMGI
jgi:hypothetical protein